MLICHPILGYAGQHVSLFKLGLARKIRISIFAISWGNMFSTQCCFHQCDNPPLRDYLST